MVSGRTVPLPARWPAAELVASSAQPKQELAPAFSQLCLPQLRGPLAGGLRHELVPSPAPIDRPGRRSPTGGRLPFLAPRQPAVLGVPLPHRFDGLLVVGGAHSGCPA
jgi:hypothetical protein